MVMAVLMGVMSLFVVVMAVSMGVICLFVVVMAVCVDGCYGSTFYGCTYGLYVKSCHDSSIMLTHQSILFNQIGNREFRQNTIFAAVTEKG